MQIKQFNELSKSGGVRKVVIIARKGGYSIIVRSDHGDEPVRTQKGKVRMFANWETLKAKLDDAGIKSFSVVGD